MYRTGTDAIKERESAKRSVLMVFFLGPIFLFAFIYLNYITMRDWFCFTLPFICIFYCINSIYNPIRYMKRFARTVHTFLVEKESVKITTLNLLWIKSQTITIERNHLSVKRSKFQWYGKIEKWGLEISNSTGDSFYIVADYFDNYHDIEQELNIPPAGKNF